MLKIRDTLRTKGARMLLDRQGALVHLLPQPQRVGDGHLGYRGTSLIRNTNPPRTTIGP